MKKRLLASFLTIVMLLGMLPTSVFAAAYSESNPLSEGNYQAGDTYASTNPGAELPKNIAEKTVWSSAEKATTCSLEADMNHKHTDACYTENLICGHDYGHTSNCYSGSEQGKWVACDKTTCEHYKSGKVPGFGEYSYHYGAVIPEWLGDLINVPTCKDCANVDALKLLKVLPDTLEKLGVNVTNLRGYIATNYSWLDAAIAAAGDSNYVHYEKSENATEICGHGDTHVSECYAPTCTIHVHSDALKCYNYTWTLKANVNGNETPDDKETYTVVYDVNGANSEYRNQSFSGLKYGVATPEYTNYGTAEVTPERTNYTFTGWDPEVAATVSAPSKGNTITYTAKWTAKNAPQAPTLEDIETILGNEYEVTVDCINGSGVNHTEGKYGLVQDYIDVGTVTGNADTGYTVNVTLSANKYAAYYDTDKQFATGTHTTTNEDVVITLSYKGEEWVAPADLTKTAEFNVACTTCTVTYHAAPGANGPDVDYVLPNTNGHVLDAETKPTHENEDGVKVIFVGWTLGINGEDNSKIYAVNDDAPVTVDEVDVGTANVTVYAAYAFDTDGDGNPDYKDTKYTVTFDTDGGSSVASQTVPQGGKATEPVAPTKDGHTFAGWTLNGAEFSFATVITGNITLKAAWTPDVDPILTTEYDWIKVELNDNAKAAQDLLEGTVPSVTVTHEKGSIVTAGAAKEWWGANGENVTGQELTGVKLAKDSNSIDLAIKGIVTVTEDYTVTLSQETYNVTGVAGILNWLPEKAQEWILSAIKSLPETDDAIDALNAALNEQIDKYDFFNQIDPIEIKLPVKLDKTAVIALLESLFDDGQATIDYLLIKVEKANEPEIPTYTVAFNSNGGSDVKAQNVKHGETATEPADPTKENYVFDGWYDGDTKFEFSTKIYKDYTLTAKWGEDFNNDKILDSKQKFTVVYMDGDTVLKTYPNREVGAKTPEFEGTPVKQDYLFVEWQPAVAETINAADAKDSDNQLTIVYTAQWEKIDLNTTVFDLIHVHMDADTKADFDALVGDGLQHVRLNSAKYTNEVLGYRVMAPIGTSTDSADWWTENFIQKVTANEIDSVVLADDNQTGASDVIIIPVTEGTEKYAVELSYEMVPITVYGVDMDALEDLLNEIKVPEINTNDLSQLLEIIKLAEQYGLEIQDVLKLLALIEDIQNGDYSKVQAAIEELLAGSVDMSKLEEIIAQLENIDLAKIQAVLENIDLAEIQAAIEKLTGSIDMSKLEEIIAQLQNVDQSAVQAAVAAIIAELTARMEGIDEEAVKAAIEDAIAELEKLSGDITAEEIENILADLKVELEGVDLDAVKTELKDLLSKLESMDKNQLINKIKDLVNDQIPAGVLEKLDVEALKELLKTLITEKEVLLPALCINISKKDAPEVPTTETLTELLKDQITVDCVGEANHDSKTYGYLQEGIKLGAVTETDTTWTCEATVYGWAYVAQYGIDLGDVASHPATDAENTTITLTWDGEKWVVTQGATIEVNCDKEQTVKQPTQVTEDLLKVLLDGQITVDCINEDAEHADEAYGWLEGGVTIGEVNGNVCPITIVSWVYADQYNKDVAAGHPVTVLPDTHVVNLTWNGDSWTVNAADMPTIEVECVNESDQVVQHTVTFNYNYGGKEIRVLVKDGEQVAAPTDTTRTNYRFNGWYLDGVKYDFTKAVTGDITLVAGWTYVGGGSGGSSGGGKPATTSKVKGLNTKDHIAYVAGYPDGTVRPEGDITRAEMAAIFCNLMTDSYIKKYSSTTNPYLDVAEDDWFNPFVSTMYKAGAIKDSEDYFRPNEPITRAELAVMAAQFATSKTAKASTFSDVSKNYWAADEIALVQKMGWISGYPDGTYRPDNNITRAEAMAIINNMLERAVEEEHMLKGMIEWIDNPTSAWYYEIVQEATNGHTYKRTSEKVGGNDYYYERWIKLVNKDED